jgi:hypothetical protein
VVCLSHRHCAVLLLLVLAVWVNNRMWQSGKGVGWMVITMRGMTPHIVDMDESSNSSCLLTKTTSNHRRASLFLSMHPGDSAGTGRCLLITIRGRMDWHVYSLRLRWWTQSTLFGLQGLGVSLRWWGDDTGVLSLHLRDNQPSVYGWNCRWPLRVVL